MKEVDAAARALPPLDERFEIRREDRWCIYRVGGVEPVAVCKTEASALHGRDLFERKEHPWYSKLAGARAAAEESP